MTTYKQRPYANGHAKRLIVPSLIQINAVKAMDWIMYGSVKDAVNPPPVTNITVIGLGDTPPDIHPMLSDEQVAEICKAFGVPIGLVRGE